MNPETEGFKADLRGRKPIVASIVDSNRRYPFDGCEGPPRMAKYTT